MELSWLPRQTDWSASLRAAREAPASEAADRLIELANCRIDFLQTAKLDRIVEQFGEPLWRTLNRTPPLRLALIGSSTLTHLIPGIRVAALRRGFHVEIFEGLAPRPARPWQRCGPAGSSRRKNLGPR
jgi:hypothetical protein